MKKLNMINLERREKGKEVEEGSREETQECRMIRDLY